MKGHSQFQWLKKIFYSSLTMWLLTRYIILYTVTALKDITSAASLRVSCGPGKSSTLGLRGVSGK